MPITINPHFSLKVNGKKLSAGVHSLVASVMYEDADGIADIMKIRLMNPDYSISDNKIFAVGNDVDVFMGYEGDLKHICKSRIYKNKPFFTRDSMPYIEITGYSRDHEMMHYSPPKSSEAAESSGENERSSGKKTFVEAKYSEAVEDKAKTYGFETDIDETPSSATDFIQPSGMSDYDFVEGLANITGFIWWVDASENGGWTLHFKNPEGSALDQTNKFKFEHNLGNQTTLFEFEPEFLVSDSIGRIRARVLNTETDEVIEAEFTENSDSGSPDVKYDGGAPSTEEVEKSPDEGTSVQIYIEDFTFYEVSNRSFKDEEDLEKWVRQWFRRSRENFIFARGLSIGINSVKSRQVHEIANVGTMYSGDYYFSRVAHKCDDDGYTIDFGCRKQTTKV